MIRFESPLALLLLLLPFAVWGYARLFKRGAIPFSSIALAKFGGISFRQRLSFLPTAIKLLAFLLIVIALARPQAGNEKIENINQGIAVEMLLDRSGSMALGMESGNTVKSRLDVAKTVFSNFVFGNQKELQGRNCDLIGLITFAKYADTICPLTLSHEVLTPFLKSVAVADNKIEDGTAIGDAIALGAARLHTVEENLKAQSKKQKDDYKIRSKVLILLTDGENNCGKRGVIQAGKIANEWGIKLYVIMITGNAYRPVMNAYGETRWSPVLINSQPSLKELTSIAEESGGFCKMADDAKSLTSLYEEIDRLEKSQVESTSYVDYHELYLPFLIAAFILLCINYLLNATIFRRLP